MSECGHLQRTQSVEDEDHGNRGSSASSPPALPLKKGRGGRKVMFPSAEEKKQRNRDSQAAFRERRKEHIAELEQIVQDQKEKLQESQRAQASAKEEVLVLKYKNSLLERILLEQGIDVNAELNNILVFPPRIPEKRARMERPLLRKKEVVPLAATRKRPLEASTSPVVSTECCHCSGHRHLSPGLPSTTPPTVFDSAPASEERPSKRRRHGASHATSTTYNKHATEPAQQKRVSCAHRSTHPAPAAFPVTSLPTSVLSDLNSTARSSCSFPALFSPGSLDPPSSSSNSSSSSTVPQPQPQICPSPATTWAPTPPLPLDVAAENDTFGLDLDFEADFTFGGMMAGAGEKFDLDLGFLSSVHV
ncbi:hypothetical protein LZ554_003790 [Drepanopeziza brunnea f. sp. 'monogermtubi']|nr:hypothetical protein LZ554_003790 [Drepanopeziza brunnea f. sp. 'monogermtubi']